MAAIRRFGAASLPAIESGVIESPIEVNSRKDLERLKRIFHNICLTRQSRGVLLVGTQVPIANEISAPEKSCGQ